MPRGSTSHRPPEPEQSQVQSQALDPELVKLRRKQIVEAAIKLFADQGYYKTTVQDVARKAKISTGLIYHYARTKEDILLLSLLSEFPGENGAGIGALWGCTYSSIN